MGKQQLEIGNSAEECIANFFHDKRYWAYILPKKIGGQPFDLIASKKNETWFVDVKHLEAEKVSFSFDRIEPNQWTSFRYARNISEIKNLGFVILWQKCPKTPFYLSFDKLLDYVENGDKSVKIERLERLGDLI